MNINHGISSSPEFAWATDRPTNVRHNAALQLREEDDERMSWLTAFSLLQSRVPSYQSPISISELWLCPILRLEAVTSDYSGSEHNFVGKTGAAVTTTTTTQISRGRWRRNFDRKREDLRAKRYITFAIFKRNATLMASRSSFLTTSF